MLTLILTLTLTSAVSKPRRTVPSSCFQRLIIKFHCFTNNIVSCCVHQRNVTDTPLHHGDTFNHGLIHSTFTQNSSGISSATWTMLALR